MALFSSSLVTQKSPAISSIPQCGACGLHKTCESPKMPVSGKGKMGVLVVSESPGDEEDRKNEHFAGPGGQLLRKTLDRFGVDLDYDCWKTHAVICRTSKGESPSNNQIDYCRPNLTNTIRELKPRVIIPLGGPAVRSLIGPLWKEDVGSISTWVGWQIPLQRWNCWITPTYNPDYIRKIEENQKVKEAPAIRVWFDRHLKKAVRLEGRPWDVVPDFKSQITILFNPDDVVSWIERVIASGEGAIAFDYETDRLKPDSDDSEIVCASICWKGVDTIAFPWVGSAIDAMKRLLKTSIPKIGSNIKFESRWTARHFGFFPDNFVWDTMLSAHHQDNRGGISSIKFQAFVQLGLEPWNVNIEEFLKADGTNDPNRIRECDLRQLMEYCGIDSLAEFLVAMKQRKVLKDGGIP